MCGPKQATPTSNLETLDPNDLRLVFEDMTDLRDVAEAADAVRAAEYRQAVAVAVARGRGRNWVEIGRRLGVSRQAARQRYAHMDWDENDS